MRSLRSVSAAISTWIGLAAGLDSAAGAATCNVPAVYHTIAAALADPTCDPIVVAAGTFAESPLIARSVTLQGAGSASTTIAGWVQVRGSAAQATVSSLRVDATAASASLCHASGLDALGGARVTAANVVVVGSPVPTSGCGFFSDGFEGGTLAAWSASR